MAHTYRALGALLSYPTTELQAATGEIAALLADEGIVPAKRRAAIQALLDELAVTDIYELQERYFALFDRSRTLSLHLFEHVHGESCDRGQAMADLVALYAGHGLRMTASELPDFSAAVSGVPVGADRTARNRHDVDRRRTTAFRFPALECWGGGGDGRPGRRDNSRHSGPWSPAGVPGPTTST